MSIAAALLGFLALGLWVPTPARADLLAGWVKTNSNTAPTNYLAQINHSKLTSSAVMQWKPWFYTFNDNSWFYIEPFTTNKFTNGIAPSDTNLRTNPPSTSAADPYSPPFIEFRFEVPNGYKLSITNMLWRMQNDERRLMMVMRASTDGYQSNAFVNTGWPGPGQTDLTVQHSTNRFLTYTNSMNVLDVIDPTLRLRLYGTESISRWVYLYATNMIAGDKYPGQMIVFEGEVVRRADLLPTFGPVAGGTIVTITNVPQPNLGNGSDITSIVIGTGVDAASTTEILGQGANWVRWTMPPAGSLPIGVAQDIRVNSTSAGTTTFIREYTYKAATTTTLESSANPSTYGASVTFTATIQTNGVTVTAATGTVTFKEGGATLGSGILSGGAATYSTSALSGGNHDITAEYGGDGSYLYSATAALTQRVNGIGQPPVAHNDTLGAVRNVAVSLPAAKLAANDVDADGDSLTVTAVTTPSAEGGTAVLLGGVVTFTPKADFVGPDSFTYTVSDGNGNTALGMVAVTVVSGTGVSLNVTYGPVVDGGDFVVRFAGTPGYTYTIESTTSFEAPVVWQKKANHTAPTEPGSFGKGVFEFRENTGGAMTRYYRSVYPAY